MARTALPPRERLFRTTPTEDVLRGTPRSSPHDNPSKGSRRRPASKRGCGDAWQCYGARSDELVTADGVATTSSPISNHHRGPSGAEQL
ncbi:hypothetical protein NL676_016914 [Syzygium grande]|nr:hypothetical protein NL676_016914 [Syzygium grande]